MTRHMLPVDVPCAVCLNTITGWAFTPDQPQQIVALPCHCTLAEIRYVYDDAIARAVDPGGANA